MKVKLEIILSSSTVGEEINQLNLYFCVHVCVYIYIYIYIFVYICIYMCIYVYVYLYIYISLDFPLSLFNIVPVS